MRAILLAAVLVVLGYHLASYLLSTRGLIAVIGLGLGLYVLLCIGRRWWASL